MIEKMTIDPRYYNKGIHDVFYYELDVPVKPKFFKKDLKIEKLQFIVIRFKSDYRKNVAFVYDKGIYKKLLAAMVVSESLRTKLPEKSLNDYEVYCYNSHDDFSKVPRWMTDETRVVFSTNSIQHIKNALNDYTIGHICKETIPLQIYTPECPYTVDETLGDKNVDSDDVVDIIQDTNDERYDIGVETVDYALKWLAPKGIITVPRDCIWKNSKCIRLMNPNYIDEPQEFDHIVIMSGCVIMIETKNYKGKIHIDEYGNWSREIDGDVKGLRNPKQQIDRHVDLLKSIVGSSVTVIGVVCLSHPEVLITGGDNTDLTIVRSDLLGDYIMTMKDKYGDVIDSEETKNEILNTINSFKIRKVTKVG